MSRAAKGADCKSAGLAFVGSSPTSPTSLLARPLRPEPWSGCPTKPGSGEGGLPASDDACARLRFDDAFALGLP